MHTTRRSFLMQAAPLLLRRDKLRLASFGGGGMAYVTLDGIATHPNVSLACVAEVDSAQLPRLKKRYPDARIYEDWRRMLDQEGKNLDLACVGTPDHMHAPQAMSAMQLGLPVYVQKPLAHDIHETRKLAEMARKKRLVTQMGIQRHSSAEYLLAIRLIQGGAIGKVRQVHAWSEKKWGDMNPFPERSDPVPDTLNWDLWLGVASARPYIHGCYHPGEWRKRADFGTATFGDMGCHIYDPVFASLDLTAPLTVRSEGPAPPNPHNWAVNAVIHYLFPSTRFTEGKTVSVTWYDGDERPPRDVQALLGARRLPGQGSIFMGSQGVMLLPHVGMPVLLPEDRFKDFNMPKVEPVNHYHQFVDAVLGHGHASTALDYSGPLTEAVLLGPVATHYPKTTLEWDARKLRFRNLREAGRHLRRPYRAGWRVRRLS